MQALPSIAFGGFSGSAKGVTARQVDGRTILSVRSWPTGVATNAQVVRRASMAKITKSYQTLTDAQMQEWERLAEHASGASVFGQINLLYLPRIVFILFAVTLTHFPTSL